jgi:hypothetical protein
MVNYGEPQNPFVSFGKSEMENQDEMKDYIDTRNNATFIKSTTQEPNRVCQSRLNANSKILLNFARINKPESKYVREFRKLQQDKQKSQDQLDEEGENQSSSYSPKQ